MLPDENSSLQDALAALISNTKRGKRPSSIPEIADWIDVATHKLGSLDEVANRVSISKKMLRQFLAIRDLDSHVVELYRSRELDSVDAVVHLRQLQKSDQLFVSNQLKDKYLNTGDLRAVCEFKKENPNTSIEAVVEKIKNSRNITQYVVEFVIRGNEYDQQRNRFEHVIGVSEVVELEITGSVGKLVITSDGRKKLQQLARSQRVTQAQLVSMISSGDLPND